MKRTFLLITSLLCSVCLSACSTSGAGGAGAASREPTRREFFAMDTYMRFSAYGEGAEQALQEAEEEIYRLESEWSVTDEGSEIYQVNHSGGTPVELSDETSEIVRFALDMAEETDDLSGGRGLGIHNR